MRRPHLLYIAFFYPPSRASGVHRALATSKAFSDAGWRVTVITTTPRFFEEEIGSTDDSLLDFIPEGVEVVRVPFSFTSGNVGSNLREIGWWRGNFPLLWRYTRDRTQWLRSYVEILRGKSPLSFPMTDRYLTWIEPVVKAGSRVHAEAPVDHILATGNPYSSFEAARVLHGLTGAPFSIDYRDPWSFDLRTGRPAKLDAPTRSAEVRIVSEAAAVIHVNQPIANAYEELYPEFAEKQRVVLNGYDKSSIGVAKRYDGGPLSFGMLGTVTDLWPLGPLFEAWAEARDELPAGSMLRMAGHLGYFAWSEEGILNTLPDRSAGFVYEGPVEKAEVAAFYGSLDVVLVPLFGGPMVTSGKIFEAAGLGIPVICIQQEDGGARQILQDHPMAFNAEADPDKILQALLDAATAAQTIQPDDVERIRQQMSRFERTSTMSTMVEIVDQSTPGRSA
jgi:glycosyltransferase involved in cell wall biosynthesis